jgi:hypothetical protein
MVGSRTISVSICSDGLKSKQIDGPNTKHGLVWILDVSGFWVFGIRTCTVHTFDSITSLEDFVGEIFLLNVKLWSEELRHSSQDSCVVANY